MVSLGSTGQVGVRPVNGGEKGGEASQAVGMAQRDDCGPSSGNQSRPKA